MVTIRHRGETQQATQDTWQAVVEEMIARLGPWVPGETIVDFGGAAMSPLPPAVTIVPPPPVAVGTVDDGARERIEAQQAALRAQGVDVQASQQLYATGTRMADVGYETQRERAREHEAMLPLAVVAAQLTQAILNEKRHEVTLTGREIAKGLAMNGKLTLNGYRLGERAIRGMLGRADSGASGYVMALRDRIVAQKDSADKAHLLATLQREMDAASADLKFTMRARDGLGDIFACVSPTYAIADAPMILPSIVETIGADVKASYAYNPTSATWNIRAEVFTPTPVDLQHVGEPFRGFVDFKSGDGGNMRLFGGGGIDLLRCLNASIYNAMAGESSRMHRGRILYDLPTMVREASKAINALIVAWGTARETIVDVPESDSDGALIPIDQVIPGLFRGLLTDRRSEYLGVLPGKRETHVALLAKTFDSERRDGGRIVRADLANAFTRYAQTQPFDVRRTVESASASWVVGTHSPRYEAR